MKKILFISISILISHSIYAQLSFGPKVGITNYYQKIKLSGVYSTYSKPTSVAKIAYTFGGTMNYQMGEILSIRSELLFERVSFTNVQSDITLAPVYYQEDLVKLNYLTVPVNLGFTNRKVIFLAGARFSYLLGGNVDRKTMATDSTFISIQNQETIKASGKKQDALHSRDSYHTNPLCIYLNIGGGYKLTDRLQLEFQYIFGLTNTTPHYTDSTLEANRDDFKVKNRSFTISALYYFGSVD